MPRHGPLALKIFSTTLKSSRLTLCRPQELLIISHTSRFSTTRSRRSQSAEPVTAALSSRWLSDLKARLGKCIQFGLKPEQVRQAGVLLQEIAKDWRELVAGSEGFLTGPDRRGIFRREVVWGEMHCAHAGQHGHVNNVTYNRWAESARINWAQHFADTIDPAHRREWSELWTPKGDGMILRSIRTDFKFPMTWPDHVTVYHKIRSLPTASTDSFVLDVIILSELHRRPAARLMEDIVVYDYRKAKKTPLRPFMLEQFRETFRLQEEAKKHNEDRVEMLMGKVQELEKASWNRADAKEDMGGSIA